MSRPVNPIIRDDRGTKRILKLALGEAREHLEQVEEWTELNLATALERQTKAKALIELLEVYYCGSIGGFDKFAGRIQEREPRHSSLKTRLKWLEKVRKGEPRL